MRSDAACRNTRNGRAPADSSSDGVLDVHRLDRVVARIARRAGVATGSASSTVARRERGPSAVGALARLPPVRDLVGLLIDLLDGLRDGHREPRIAADGVQHVIAARVHGQLADERLAFAADDALCRRPRCR